MTQRHRVAVGVEESLGELQGSLAGTVIVPGDPEYDAARVSFNAAIDRHPAVITRCAGPDDVVAALDYRTHDRPRGRSPWRRAQPRGPLPPRRRARHRPLAASRRGRRRRSGRRPRPRRLDLARLRRGDAGLRLRNAGRRSRLHGRLRANARRRNRPPDCTVRPDVRQPRRGRARHARRRDRPRRAKGKTRSSSGPPRRGRELRRRDTTRVQPRPARERRRRVARPSAARASRDALRRFRDVVAGFSARPQLPGGSHGGRVAESRRRGRALLHGLGRRAGGARRPARWIGPRGATPSAGTRSSSSSESSTRRMARTGITGRATSSAGFPTS